MTLNGVMAVTLHYFTEFGKHIPTHNRRIDLWRNLCTSLLYFVVRVRTEMHILIRNAGPNFKGKKQLNSSNMCIYIYQLIISYYNSHQSYK